MVINIIALLMAMIGLAGADGDRPILMFALALAGLLILKRRATDETIRNR